MNTGSESDMRRSLSAALDAGDFDQADSILKEMEKEHRQRAAEVAKMRGTLALVRLRDKEAAEHFCTAERMAASGG